MSEVSREEADTYYASRDRGSRIGAWASRQSRPLESRFALEKAVAEYGLKFGIGAIPRPDHWSGLRVAPGRSSSGATACSACTAIVFEPDGKGGWTRTRLYP